LNHIPLWIIFLSMTEHYGEIFSVMMVNLYVCFLHLSCNCVTLASCISPVIV
jgi:hypothetical protein